MRCEGIGGVAIRIISTVMQTDTYLPTLSDKIYPWGVHRNFIDRHINMLNTQPIYKIDGYACMQMPCVATMGGLRNSRRKKASKNAAVEVLDVQNLVEITGCLW